MNDIQLLDCTIRDGGYINNWDFSEDFTQSLYRAASDSGCSYVEIGFYNPKYTGANPWLNCSARHVHEIKEANPGGAGIAVMIDFGSCEANDLPDPSEYPVDLIRVATPKKHRLAATQFAAELGRRGYCTTVNYMAVTEYSNEEILDLAHIINQHREQVEFFYIADSFGSLLPRRAREIFSALKFSTSAKLGFHPHNNLQLAFANSLEAIDAGFHIIDGSIFGMGRGAGNLFLEAALAYLERQSDKFRLLPVLQFADLFVEALKAQYTWGYSLPQLISGVLSCHPNYPTNLLGEKLYTADEIYHMLQRLSPDNRSRFSAEIMAGLKREYGSQELRGAKHEPQPHFIDAISSDRPVLLIAGGSSVSRESDAIKEYMARNSPYIISVNNPVSLISHDAVFFANRRRLLQHYRSIEETSHVVFSQSIIPGADKEFKLRAVSWINVAKAFKDEQSPFPTIVPGNSTIEALLAVLVCGAKEVVIAGLDGFSGALAADYYAENLDSNISPVEAANRNHLLEAELRITHSLFARCGATFSIITSTFFKEFKK